jgi:hypothetical protein
VTGGWRKTRNKELRTLQPSYKVTGVLKCVGRLRHTGR